MLVACPSCGGVFLQEFAPTGCPLCKFKEQPPMQDLQCKCGTFLVARLLVEKHEWVFVCSNLNCSRGGT